MMNKIMIVGNLGSDPELRTTNNGVVVASFSVATEVRVKKGDNFEKQTDWHKVICFGGTAEAVGRYLKKGKKVGVVGRMQYRSWEDKDGLKRTAAEIIPDFDGGVEFLSPRDSDSESSSGSSGNRSNGNGRKQRDYEEPDDDGIPF